MQLFGFPTLLEKEWHRLLMTVQGVGAKASMAILGTLGADGVGRAIALGDWSSVKAAPGVGPKLAQRVVLELKEKAPAVMALGGALTVEVGAPDDAVIEPPPRAKAGLGAPAARPMMTQASATADALSALLNLGYAQGEAAAAVAQAAGENEGAATPALIRASLKLLAPKG